MKQLIFACALLVLGPQLQAEERTGAAAYAAGIILYAETPDGVVLLLADHAPPSSRGWAAFGGRSEPGESTAETAARETEEETHGFFKREVLLEAIRNREPVYDVDYPFYLVKVDFVPVAEIENKWIAPWKIAYWERGPYAWIPYSQIERYLGRDSAGQRWRIDPQYLPNDKYTDWLWSTWVDSLNVARRKGALPWERASQRSEDRAETE